MGMLASLRHSVLHEIKTLRGALYRRIAADKENERALVDAFHKLYFDARAFNMTWRNTYWMGQPILKCPLDLWLYQELIHRLRPDVVVETGTAFGASAHFLACMMDLVGTGNAEGEENGQDKVQILVDVGHHVDAFRRDCREETEHDREHDKVSKRHAAIKQQYAGSQQG